MFKSNLFLAALVLVVGSTGCMKKKGSTDDAGEDSSATGMVTAVVGGALSSSGSGGAFAFNSNRPFNPRNFSLIPNAYATNLCPTFHTASGAGCTVSSGDMWLNYSNCAFGVNEVLWNGVQ